MSKLTVIEQLQSLDLRTVSDQEIRRLLRELNKHGAIVTTIYPGRKILRGSPLKRKSETHDSISRLSYKPQSLNSEYQRASTPNQTMFYGAIIPIIRHIDEPPSPRITVMYEIYHDLVDPESEFEKFFTVSVWEVKQEINLISLVQADDLPRTAQSIVELNQYFEKYVEIQSDTPNELKMVSGYLAKEFSKLPIDHHTDYKISANYSEMVTHEGYDGVLFPSTRLGGHGVNVALSPKAVDNKLRFIAAGKHRLKKSDEIKLEEYELGFLDNSSGLIKYDPS